MSPRRVRLFTAHCGILGTIMLGLYFGIGAGVGLATLSPEATQAQILSMATQYHDLWYLGTWLQGTGTLLSVIFFLSLVQQAGASSKLAGVLTLLGSAVLLGVVLIEGVFTIDLAQAAADGHQATSVTSFDLMSVFSHIYPIAPAPVIFLALGIILVGARVLPRGFGYVAFVLGVVFAIAGLVGLFTTPILTLIPLALQGIWIVVAAITMLFQAPQTPKPAVGVAQA